MDGYMFFYLFSIVICLIFVLLTYLFDMVNTHLTNPYPLFIMIAISPIFNTLFSIGLLLTGCVYLLQQTKITIQRKTNINL